MIARVVIIIVVGLKTTSTTPERGDACVTPKNENGTCSPLKECHHIYNALKANDSNIVEFAKKSQCGFDIEPLICCRSHHENKTEDYLYDLFTRKPVVAGTTPSTKQQIYGAISENFEIKGLSDRSVCGLEASTNRIKGGTLTELGEFPWVAALEYKSNITGKNVGINCGGSVITKRYILTAAHCLTHQELKVVSVRLGEWDTTKDPDCDDAERCVDPVQNLKVEKIIPHEYYHLQTRNNDIGLLRIERDINYTDYIRPICLPSPYLPLPPNGTIMTVSGWGATENGAFSNVKLKVNIPVRPNTLCNEQLKLAYDSRTVIQNQLCAGGELGKDSCEGDSGGPLMRPYYDKMNGQTRWYQEGLVSYGIGCGGEGRPAIYTRVSSYVVWIANNILE